MRTIYKVYNWCKQILMGKMIVVLIIEDSCNLLVYGGSCNLFFLFIVSLVIYIMCMRINEGAYN